MSEYDIPYTCIAHTIVYHTNINMPAKYDVPWSKSHLKIHNILIVLFCITAIYSKTFEHFLTRFKSRKTVLLNSATRIPWIFWLPEKAFVLCRLVMHHWLCAFDKTCHGRQTKMFNDREDRFVKYGLNSRDGYPDSNVHVAHMGPTWILSAPGGPHVGPMNLAIRVYKLYDATWIHLMWVLSFRTENSSGLQGLGSKEWYFEPHFCHKWYFSRIMYTVRPLLCYVVAR